MGPPSARHQAGEAHEGHGHETGGDQGDGVALEGFGNVGHVHTLANGGEEHQHQGETHRGTETVQGRFHEVVLLLGIKQGHTQHRAVGGDQRQEDAQHLVEHRAGLVHHHFGELHHHGDHQDEGDGAHVLQSQGLEHPGVDQVAGHRGEGEHEGGGQPHAHGGLQLARHAHEGTEPQELHQDEVVHQDGAYQDQRVFGHGTQEFPGFSEE